MQVGKPPPLLVWLVPPPPSPAFSWGWDTMLADLPMFNAVPFIKGLVGSKGPFRPIDIHTIIEGEGEGHRCHTPRLRPVPSCSGAGSPHRVPPCDTPQLLAAGCASRGGGGLC